MWSTRVGLKHLKTIFFFCVEQHNTIQKLANQIYFHEWISSELTAMWISLCVSLHIFFQCTEKQMRESTQNRFYKQWFKNYKFSTLISLTWEVEAARVEQTTVLLIWFSVDPYFDSVFKGKGRTRDGKYDSTCEAQTAGSCEPSHTECRRVREGCSKSLCWKTNSRRDKQSHRRTILVALFSQPCLMSTTALLMLFS